MRTRISTLLRPLGHRDCRTLFGAQLVSGLGDWAGRLALAVLVYDRSDSALWTAAVTVVSLLPWLGPGQVLATFADRFGRVRVMIVADLARAALFAVMIIPQPTALLLGWAFLAGLCVPPFVGSRSSAMVEVTDRETYQAALALYGVLSQTEILVGYSMGGLLIAATGPRLALIVNAGTFVVSAVVLRRLAGSEAATTNERSEIGWAGVRSGITVWRDEPICRRALVLFVGVSMFMVLPEALVVPVTSEIGVSSELVGVFAALVAVGSIVGMLTIPTAASHIALLRITAVRAAVLATISGLLFSLGTVPVVAGIAFVVSGLVDATAVPTNQVVGERLPTAGRAAAMAVAGGVLYASQAASVLVAGTVASLTTARTPLAIGMFAAAAVGLWAALREPASAATTPATDDRRPPRRPEPAPTSTTIDDRPTSHGEPVTAALPAPDAAQRTGGTIVLAPPTAPDPAARPSVGPASPGEPTAADPTAPTSQRNHPSTTQFAPPSVEAARTRPRPAAAASPLPMPSNDAPWRPGADGGRPGSAPLPPPRIDTGGTATTPSTPGESPWAAPSADDRTDRPPS